MEELTQEEDWKIRIADLCFRAGICMKQSSQELNTISERLLNISAESLSEPEETIIPKEETEILTKPSYV